VVQSKNADSPGLLALIRSDIARAWPTASATRRLWYCIVEPGLTSVLLMRVQVHLEQVGIGPLAKIVRSVNHCLTGLDWVVGARSGGGLVIRHPSGIVIGHRVVIGENATILQNVTLGQKSARTGSGDSGNPILGNHVLIGAGAVVLGAITLGDGCIIGANAFVGKDVSANVTMVGNPAREIQRH
jgi:serine O-acetyltransferase